MQRSRNRLLRHSSALLITVGAMAALNAPAAGQVREDSIRSWMPDSAAVFLGHHRITPEPLRLIRPRLAEPRIELHWTDLSGRWWRALEAKLAAARDTLWLGAHGIVPVTTRTLTAAAAPDSVVYLPYDEEPVDTAQGVTDTFLPGAVDKYADLGMVVRGRGEMGGAWQHFEPCDIGTLQTCDQGLAPRLRPDIQFGVLMGGTITDRIHVTVDYDQTREFDAANNINVYYQGLEDEILQRFEMGDVSIDMPRSQYMTGGLPGGNFGFRALAQVGPLELQTVWAQQQGDIGTLDIPIDARTGSLYEEGSITLDDHRYASGRFFFVVDPAQLTGYPHVDVLTLERGDAPAAMRPAQGFSVEIYRDERLPASQQQASRVFLGHALAPGVETDTVTGYFRRLEPSDYVVHPSGLWIMLRQPLGPEETLAISYLTETGDTVGTLDAGATASSSLDDAPVLQLLRGPIADHHPQAPTWDYEMHQVYQVYTGEVEAEDLQLQIRLGDALQGQPFVEYEGSQIPLLRLFGMDESSPADQIDPERVFHPSELQTGTSVITGTYVFFPTLRPFAEPPPTSELTAEQAAAALGDDANDRIYEERDPDLRSVTRFRMIASYRVETDGLMSEFSLGSFGVRDGSERIVVDGVQLQRGSDYTVDYATGIVRLLNPQQLFAGNQSPRITAQFERSALFEIAPKSIFGSTARFRVGQAGDVNLVGFYQTQRSVMARPELGNEPSSILMGGITTNLRFDAGWMDRGLDAIPGLRLAGESSIAVNGEVAMSLPNPNTRGAAYLDDFEATAEVPIPMSQLAWRLGSKPSTAEGGTGAFPFIMDQSTIGGLVWQHQAYAPGGGMFGATRPERVDTTIVTVGREVPEPVLYVTMSNNPDRAPDERIWRSMTTVLSTRGSDLTQSEYLEFYAAANADDFTLVFDVGSVSEDAFFVDAEGRVTGTHPVTEQPWGIDVLDQEAGYDQPWGVDLDHGIWDQDCVGDPGSIYVLGSATANCTVDNGINDTEDLNGDGVPNLRDGAFFRYVVPISDNSPYLARDRSETGSNFRLYRIPLRGAGGIALNGATDETWRSVRHLRVTLTRDNCPGDGCGAEVIAFSRMRISGSTWKKREIDGVMEGMVGRDPVAGDYSRSVHVGPVSALTDGNAYLGPPGASDQASDPSQQYGIGGQEVNEKGLRIAASDLEPDARAEVFYRFPSDTRSFMEYQQLRLWALPRAGDWGPDGSLSLLVKIGTDDDNYYLYRTRLRPPVENRDIVSRAYWLPEVVVDFEPWFDLKARAETDAVLVGDSARVLWNEDSTYAIVLSSRAQAPNLAGIRELSLAIHNEDGLPADSAEVWVNDLRLADGHTEADFASYVSLTATAADFANVRLSFANQGARFQPMNRDATLESSNDIGMNGRFELGHFAPAGWGLAMPVTVQHTQQAKSPEFLNRTDIQAADLEGLRETESHSTQIGVGLSKLTPATNPWIGLLIDQARLSLNWQSAEQARFTQRNATSQFGGSLSWAHQLQPRSIDITPSFFVNAMRALAPAVVEGSEFFDRLTTAELRWSPSDVSFSTSYRDRKSETFNYAAVLESHADSAVTAIRSPERDLANAASISFRPVESLTTRLGMTSARDLLDGADLQTSRFGQEAVADARRDLAGIDLGWERARSVSGMVQFQPRIAAWLRPSVSWSSDYHTSRTPRYLEYDTMHTGTSVDTMSALMQRDFDVNDRFERRLHFDPAGLVRATWGEELEGAGTVRRLLHRVGTAILPLELTLTNEQSSNFQRSPGEPSWGYRFGMGDLSDLRIVAGDTAVTATERAGLQLRGGVMLPFDLQLDAMYEDRTREALSRQGADNLIEDRIWPDVRLGLGSVPIPEALRSYVSQITASTGYRVEHSEQRFGSTLRDREAVRIPIQFSMVFAQGFSASYTGAFGESESRETTGRRRGEDAMHAVQIRGTFDPPEMLQPRLENPLTASLGYTYTANMACDVARIGSLPGAGERCAPSTDRLSRDIHFTLETRISDLNVGAQFSMNQHQSFIGRRDGNREFRLAVFANFNFGIGSLPPGFGAAGMGY